MSIKHPLLTKCRRTLSVGIVIFTSLLFSAFTHAMDIEEAVAKVQEQQGGKVLDIQRVSVHNAPAYRIKLLRPKGRVEVLLIDAKSGEPLSTSKAKQ